MPSLGRNGELIGSIARIVEVFKHKDQKQIHHDQIMQQHSRPLACSLLETAFQIQVSLIQKKGRIPENPECNASRFVFLWHTTSHINERCPLPSCICRSQRLDFVIKFVSYVNVCMQISNAFLLNTSHENAQSIIKFQLNHKFHVNSHS